MKARAAILTGILVLCISMADGLRAGQMTPPGPPGSTMKSLQEIWDKLEAISAELAEVRARNTAIERHLMALAHYQGMLRDWVIRFFSESSVTLGYATELVIAPDGHPAIAFWDSNKDLRYWKRYDFGWSKTTIPYSDDIGHTISLAFKSDGSPLIAFINDTTQNVMLAVFNPTTLTWSIRPVTTTGRHSRGCSLIMLSDMPAIAYEDSSPAIGLRVALWDPLIVGGWKHYSVGPLYYVKHLSFARPAGSGRPGIACIAGNHSISLYYVEITLKGASIVGSTSTPVDETMYVASGSEDCSLAFSPSGDPAIAYRHHYNDALMFARLEGEEWTTEVVDQGDGVGGGSSLAFDAAGQLAIAYSADNSNSGVKFARHDGQEWRAETMFAGSFRYASLKFTGDSVPAIAFGSGLSVAYAELRGDRLVGP